MQHDIMEERQRKDLVLDLLNTLPRHYRSEIHAQLSEGLRRDVIGSIPRELALHIFGFLDISSLLRCSLVNKTWQSIANDQGKSSLPTPLPISPAKAKPTSQPAAVLWHGFCEAQNLTANPLTSWRDIFAEREKVLRAEKEDLERQTRSKNGDDSWDDEIDLDDDGVQIQDFMPVSGYPGASATRRDVVERDRSVGDGTFTLPAVDPIHRRRPSFRTGRHQSGLPVFLLPADNISSTSTSNAASAAAFPASQRPSTTFPILSHLPAPFPRPQVNYKHLYLVNQIIRERFITGDQRPTILDATLSLKNGGLDGHREGVYCLQVVNRELSIPISNKQPVSPRRSVDGAAQPISIEGREWVFSGSRDRTIRLWDLNTARVIKIYQSPSPDRGHTGSVLTLHARAYEGEGGKAKGMRMISGGSDGKLVIWDVLTGAIEGEIKAHEDRQSVLSVRFDEKRIVSCSKDRSIRTYDAKTLEPLLIIGGPSPNVGVQAENHLLQADIPGPEDLEGHRAAVNAIALVRDLIISASGDRTLRVWSAETGEELTQINAHNRGIASLDVDLETGTAVTGSSDWGIRLHQLSEWGFDFSSPYPSSSESESGSDPKGPKQEDRASFVKGKKTIEPEHPNGLEFVTAKQCCRDGGGMHHSRMASTSIGPGNEDGVNEDPGMGAGTRCYVCSHRGHKELVRSLWLGENVVLSGSYDHTIKIWDRKTGVLLNDLPNLHAGRVFSVVGDRTKAVSTGLDQRIIIWDFGYGLDTSFVEM